MKLYEQLSYREQIALHRNLAMAALQKYPIQVDKVKFILHGENTTFRIYGRKEDYLLRIHRAGYHSDEAIVEELAWQQYLSLKGVKVQEPVKSDTDQLIVKENHALLRQPRSIDILKWQHGRILKKNVSGNQFYKLGNLTGLLHHHSEGFVSRHRHYWSSKGLLGVNSKFGQFSALSEIYPKATYNRLLNYRQELFNRISKYEKREQTRKGMLHADLHFANVVWKEGQPIPIDFDDCGVACHMYDLGVTLYSSGHIFKDLNQLAKTKLIEQYIHGYESQQTLTIHDFRIIPTIIAGRHLSLLIWMANRKDNPSIYDRFKAMRKGFLKGMGRLFTEIDKDIL